MSGLWQPSYRDIDGNPISQDAAIELMADPSATRIAEDQVGEDWISTVHLVLDHNFSGKGPPLIFETMIFPECRYCVRTPTKYAALAAHDQAVAYARQDADAEATRHHMTGTKPKGKPND